ncbi:MAG: ATP-binding cassette domain-containing protein [Actinobacteria bacterium]|nr:MAG: ATP-binding cassette domain-containing protein [Actinomycetota bacterium]
MSIIQVDGLVKRFNGFEAVRGVSFEVERGEVFGFLGPNGAGKTTTISMLCTLMRPSDGTASLNGHDVLKSPNQVRQSIGLVFQDPSLDERLTAMDNMLFHAMMYNVPRSDRLGRIAEMLEVVELSDRANDEVKTFSGGMKRRLEIARGLIHHPTVLFLDEPTIGLDPQTRNHIWTYINKLRKQKSITIFLTTHYMDEAEHCDRIAIIDHGKIIALDTPANLKKQVGGDVVSVRTGDNIEAARQLKQRLQVEAVADDGNLRFEVRDADQFIPKMVRALDVPVDSVQMRRPTLDDVFLTMTGRAIREEEASALDQLRSHARPWRQRH